MKIFSINCFFSISLGLLILLYACSKQTEPIILPPVPEKPFVDYKKFDFGNMAAISGHSIEDTLWDSDKRNILGFRLGKSLKHLFLYPEDMGDQYPIASSVVSTKSWQSVFGSSLYLPPEKRKITTFALNAFNENVVKYDFLLPDYSAQKGYIESFLKEKGSLPYYGHKDFIYSFQNYENIKLMFGKDADIKQLFNITDTSYPAISKEGLLYYALNPTLSLRSTFMGEDFTDYFSLEEITDKQIARIRSITYGKTAMMTIDANANEIKPVITKLSNGQELSEEEKKIINKATVYFYYYGYTADELTKINKHADNLQRVKQFINVAIKVEDLTFRPESFGRPLYFELTSHLNNTEQFNKNLYINQITFKK